MVQHRGLWMLSAEVADYEAWLIKMAQEEAEEKAKIHRARFIGIQARRQHMQSRHLTLPAPVQGALQDKVAAFDRSLAQALGLR